MTDPDDKPRPTTITLPRPLDTLSVGELEAYVAVLQTEIGRVRADIARKQAARGGADAIFKR